jgi:hypothetical protein
VQDVLPTVEITCDNGKLFTTFVSGSDCAIIWDRNLKSRFHGPLWLGTLDIRKVGSDTDFGQTMMERALAWVLPPGQYEAISPAASVGRGGSSGHNARLSFGGGPSRVVSISSFKTARPGLSVSDHLVTNRPANIKRTFRESSSARPVRQENDNDEVSSAVMKPAAEDNSEAVLGVRQPVTGPVSIGRAISTDGEGKSGVSSDGGLGAASGRGIASSIQDSVLKGSFRANHPLRMVMEEYKKRGEEVPLVQYVPVQIDGNKAYLRPSGIGLKDSLTLGKHWGSCKTTNMNLGNGEKVRYWDCKGGHRCVNQKCWYRMKAGRVATTAFEVEKETGEVMCMFCSKPAMSTRPCYAKRYQVEGKEMFAHVHWGQHNHDLRETVSQEIQEKWQVKAMKAATQNPKVTASTFSQARVREAILQRMEKGKLIEGGPDLEG